MTLTFFVVVVIQTAPDQLPPNISALKKDFVRNTNGAVVCVDNLPDNEDDYGTLSETNPSFTGTTSAYASAVPRATQASGAKNSFLSTLKRDEQKRTMYGGSGGGVIWGYCST